MKETTPTPRILLVDDDRELTAMLQEYLTPEGFEVSVSHDGAEALDRLTHVRGEPQFDLVVLDVMLPGRSGLDVLRSLRSREAPPPVLMLTARGDDVDRIVGLELGADDYLPKPFNPRELVARIRAVLRRASDRSQPHEPLSLGVLKLDPARHRASVRGAPAELTGAEFRVLEVLLRAAGRVVSREQLTEQALGRKLELYDRSVDTHVSNLRRKLALTAPGDPEIRGIRGAGYLLTVPGDEAAP
ncbi:MAG TPA: response regulator transcription factor [Steroidobacteraceae bacterium]|nr:response regulator transcription factor [Steroidobacteraceae bacterium]